jgi:AraC family transcriptional regulator
MPAHKSRLVRVMSEEQIVAITGTLPHATSIPLIRSIGMTLDAEMRSNNPKPEFYAQRLASTLASHIFVRYSAPVYREMRSLGVHWTKLRRSIEHIHANIDKPLWLDDLAMIAGMSKYHFAKSFRQAMGIPPHQYLVQARIEKASGMLGDEMMSLPQIASRVGYTDTGQFSAQFRSVTYCSGTTCYGLIPPINPSAFTASDQLVCELAPLVE